MYDSDVYNYLSAAGKFKWDRIFHESIGYMRLAGRAGLWV